MSARILVVDDIAANVKLLEAKLSAEYYIVLTASNGFEALEVARAEQPDLILLDVMMPKMDGFEACKRLKADPALAHIPVVMITALDQASDRIRGLEAGADDFLTKPANDLALFARVRSLVRVKMMIDELRLRDETCRELGFDSAFSAIADEDLSGKVLLVDDRPNAAKSIKSIINEKLHSECVVASNRDDAMNSVRFDKLDIMLINAGMESYDGLRLCSEIRSSPQARHASVILMVDHGDYRAIAAALDLGANDYVMRPLDENELVARMRSQMRRKCYADQLRDNAHNALKMAVTDPLTGLYNRRYAMPHMQALMERSDVAKSPISVALLDIDHFKSINDTYGHGVGDEVLKEFAQRIRQSVRGVDLSARIGGEEFLVVMPETGSSAAAVAAERLRAGIAAKPFTVSHEVGKIDLTVSIGLSSCKDPKEKPEAMLERADVALYRSKNTGRNRVTLDESTVAAA